jgi:ABC-type phosphate transport system substrate-binding protein
MRYRKGRWVLVTAMAVTLPLVFTAKAAFADYAPSFTDVVGVGSDTVQNAIDFLADGFPSGDTGYNALGNLYKLINFDATADQNARLAYGPDGLGSGTCHPGTGGTQGTGNQTTTHADKPCTLNPTIILRAGLSPMLRPNGSGGGFTALQNDVNAGHHYIDFSRASSARGSGSPAGTFDDVRIAIDPLKILVANTTNAVALSPAQLKVIYEKSSPCVTWNDPQIGGTSSDAIIPILPQVGSGTRSSFLSAIGTTEGALGNCAVTFEENDPTALFQVTNSADAIEPMSGGRLNLFKGLLGSGGSNGYGGFFKDPSCAAETAAPAPACTTGNTISPTVSNLTGTPGGSIGGTLFGVNRDLFVYFRDADVGTVFPSAHPWQPGSTLNWVRTLFHTSTRAPGRH